MSPRIFQWSVIASFVLMLAGSYFFFKADAGVVKVNAPVPESTITQGALVGSWSFNGGDLSTTTAFDRSGGDHHGTLTNGPTPAPGKVGQALLFNGVNQFVSIPDSNALDVTNTADLTITGWFRRNTSTTDDTLIAKRNSSTTSDPGYIAFIDAATDKLHFEVSDGTNDYKLVSTSVFTGNDWHRFTLVWNQSSIPDSEIYIDGIADNAVKTGTLTSVGDLSNALTLNIGAESDGGAPFDGKLDEIHVYNRSISATEIAKLYGVANTFQCGTSTVKDADLNQYNTVLVGTQCWMASNLKVGTRIAGASSQTNNGIIEKYCYSDTDANCTTDGGLYQWDEAMQYSTTEGSRGICPAGWHIPSDAQQYALENFLKDSGQTCDAARNGAYDCSTAGTKMKSGGTSGLNIPLAGYRFTDGSFLYRASYALLWSSLQSGGSAWTRYLNSSEARVYRYSNSKANGFSVRCLKD